MDFDESESCKRPSVKPRINAQLDGLRRWYDGMETFLTHVVNQVRLVVPRWAHKYVRSCMFLPQLGFLMVVEQDLETGQARYEGEDLENDQWERQFAADGTIYYKTAHMCELDDYYGDVYCEIGGDSKRSGTTITMANPRRYRSGNHPSTSYAGSHI